LNQKGLTLPDDQPQYISEVAHAGMSVDDQLAAIRSRLEQGSKRMKSIEDGVQEMKDSLDANTQITQSIHEFLVAARVGFKVLGGLGLLFKWAGALATGVLGVWSLWQAFRNGHPPSVK
jgi:hypothetical protein